MNQKMVINLTLYFVTVFWTDRNTSHSQVYIYVSTFNLLDIFSCQTLVHTRVQGPSVHHLQNKPALKHRHSFSYFISYSSLSRKELYCLMTEKHWLNDLKILSRIKKRYSRIYVQSCLSHLQDLIQMVTAKAVKEVSSSECPKLYISGCCILGLL